MTALAEDRAGWAVGSEDETRWSRVARPARHAGADGEAPRLVARAVAKDDPDPKAPACYGLLVRPGDAAAEAVWLRFVDGRPVRPRTTAVLGWRGARLAATGATALVLIGDTAAWRVSAEARRWLRAHNRRAHRDGGVRRVPCLLPTKSRWLNPIAPMWVHGKRRVGEPARLLTARELEERVCAAFACPACEHLAIPKELA